MKKVQMSRTNKILTSKNSPNLTSHGITLMSLIVYMTIMFVVLALIMRFTTNFTKNISDVADTTFEEEFEKLNMYMLQETNKSENYVEEVSEEQKSITFTDGNTIAFQKENESETGEIYFNSIKLCEGVDNCTFTSPDDEITNKTTITVTLTINGTTKSIQYVINDKLSIAQSTITEEVYIVEKTEEQRLPIDYQEVEYIESTGTQYIDTGFIPSSNTSIEIKVISTGNTHTALYCARNAYSVKTYTAHLLNGNQLRVDYGSTMNTIANYSKDVPHIYKQNKNLVYVDNQLVKTMENIEFTAQYNMFLFAAHTEGTSIGNIGNTLKLYYCQIYDGDVLVRKFIPCYRKSNGEIGLYDTVNGKFYTNQGTGTFLKGPEVY